MQKSESSKKKWLLLLPLVSLISWIETKIVFLAPQQLAIEANPEEAVNSAQKKIAKINNSATVQREQKSIKANQAEPLHDMVDVTVTRNCKTFFELWNYLF